MKPTINDVAALAGVSKATVSYALSGQNTSIRVSDATRRRVMEAAAALGYRPSETAAALSAMRQAPLSLLVASPWLYQQHSDFMSQIYAALAELSAIQPLSVTFMPYGSGRITAVLKPSRCRKHDAVLVIGTCAADEEALVRRADDYEGKLILVNRRCDGLSCVSGNDYDAMRTLASSVTGVDGAVLLSEGTDSFCRAERVRAISDVFGDSLTTLEWNGLADVSESVPALVKRYPRSCFCFTMANSASRMLVLLRAAGLRLPEDASVIGYDIHTLLRDYLPQPLTTVDPRVSEMVASAVALAGERRENGGSGAKQLIVEARIVPGSTARLKLPQDGPAQ